MQICLIGDFSGNPDEGMKSTSRQLKAFVEQKHQVIACHPREVLYTGILRSLRNQAPSIIHYLHGPSLRSLALLKLLSKIVPKARTMALAIKPDLGRASLPFIRFFKPDLTLVQSESTEIFFRDFGFTTSFFPIGVDLERFFPMHPAERKVLRKKFGLDEKLFIVLHVGHARRNRNLEVLADLQRIPGFQVIVVASMALDREPYVEKYLIQQGCIVWRKYFSNMGELYNLADCYVFCTRPAEGFIQSREVGCCETPISVMEAMAVNLPVITTRFGILPRLFNEGKGFYFVKGSNGSDFVRKVKFVQRFKDSSSRDMVKRFSWEIVVDKLTTIYKELGQA